MGVIQRSLDLNCFFVVWQWFCFVRILYNSFQKLVNIYIYFLRACASFLCGPPFRTILLPLSIRLPVGSESFSWCPQPGKKIQIISYGPVRKLCIASSSLRVSNDSSNFFIFCLKKFLHHFFTPLFLTLEWGFPPLVCFFDLEIYCPRCRPWSALVPDFGIRL